MAEKPTKPQHGAPRHQESPLHAEKGYEILDAQAGPTIRAGLYILATMFLVAAILVPLYWFFARRETRQQERPKTVIRTAPATATTSFPRLVTSEPRALADFRAQEEQVLNGYGWVDQSRGIARIPVDEALRIVGQRASLPSFGSAAGSSPQPTGAPTHGGGAGKPPAGGPR